MFNKEQFFKQKYNLEQRQKIWQEHIIKHPNSILIVLNDVNEKSYRITCSSLNEMFINFKINLQSIKRFQASLLCIKNKVPLASIINF
ncbi:hypothetical protein pb186bvf_016973 [Paramecium bursaria]